MAASIPKIVPVPTASGEGHIVVEEPKGQRWTISDVITANLATILDML